MKNAINVPVIFILVLAGLFLVFLAGHNTGYRLAVQKDARGFQLPEGDVEAGKQVFHEFGCQKCHTVSGSREFAIPSESKVRQVALGGRIHLMKSCGELVTSILDPQNTVKEGTPAELLGPEGQSTMPNFTTGMTARQLADLVAFLRFHYEVAVPEYPDRYYYYPYGAGSIP